MKTADEVAEDLVLYSRRESVGAVLLKEAIAQALDVFAEAKVREATAHLSEPIVRQLTTAHNRGLEEAARLFEGDHPQFNVGQTNTFKQVSDKIRALKRDL